MRPVGKRCKKGPGHDRYNSERGSGGGGGGALSSGVLQVDKKKKVSRKRRVGRTALKEIPTRRGGETCVAIES